ncbi:MAG: ligase-associated DNA damage response endonuclease PdeM [Bacteroidetes bacterium]|nr:ligase-associated DNA damage response endonuclease PdeM [Bacteroidota bacterium]
MSEGFLEIELCGESFYLLPQKAIYRSSKKQLILSDVHLGKATHFRKQGLALPASSHLKDIDKLHFLIDKWKPQTVLILGDLFHSDYNKEWLWFKALLLQYFYIEFILIEGNHDILDNDQYSMQNLLKAELLEDEHFIFSHEPLKEEGKLNICGHIHPGIRIEGMAKQAEKLPCFHLTKTHFILPAFGYLTGLFLLEKEPASNYFITTGKKVIKLF